MNDKKTRQKAKGKNVKAKGMSGFAAPIFLPFAFCLLPFDLLADILPDPTRPAGESEMFSNGLSVSASGPVLQSVMISRSRRNAVISGVLLSTGDSFGGATLIRISENEVELDGPEGKQILKLLPAVEKQPATKTKASQ